MCASLLICKFLITPTQSNDNDTGSENGRQPTASSRWQLQVSWFTFSICTSTNIQSNTFAANLQPRCSTVAAAYCRVYPQWDKTVPSTKDRAAVIGGCLGSHQSSCQAKIVSLSTHCFCPQTSFWASVWAAAMSWSQRCGRWCDMAKLLTQGSRADGTFWFWAKRLPQLARSTLLLLFMKFSSKSKPAEIGFKGNS